MGKFTRIAGQNHPTREGQRAGFELAAKLLNAHSEAIEALDARLAGRDPRWMTEVNNALRRNDHRLIALEMPLPDITPTPRVPEHEPCFAQEGSPPRMTADEAVAIVVVEFISAMTGDIHTNAWLERIRGRIISALREHGRDDHAE